MLRSMKMSFSHLIPLLITRECCFIIFPDCVRCYLLCTSYAWRSGSWLYPRLQLLVFQFTLPVLCYWFQNSSHETMEEPGVGCTLAFSCLSFSLLSQFSATDFKTVRTKLWKNRWIGCYEIRCWKFLVKVIIYANFGYCLSKTKDTLSEDVHGSLWTSQA